jgi:glucokinase
MNLLCAVGLDVGGTDIKAGLIAADGAIVARAVRPTAPQRGFDAVLADMAALAEEVISQSGRDRATVAGVGIGFPGPLSPSRGVILNAGNVPGFENVPVRDEIALSIGLPAMLDNDANVAAYAEFWVGAARDVKDMVMFTLGTGVGSGVVIDGRLLRGHFENAAELGHTIVQPEGRPCSCGQRGCLEQYASASNVARRAIEAVRAGEQSALSDTPGGLESVTSKDVVAAAAEGDDLARRIWDDACRYLAIGCINVQHTFNPARIVLGGGASAAGDLLLDGVRRHMARQCWSLADDTPQVALAELGNDAGMIGAGGLMLGAFEETATGAES